MYKVNKLILTASVLTLGMMSSAITLANTTSEQGNAQAQPASQTQQTQDMSYDYVPEEEQQNEDEEETTDSDFSIDGTAAHDFKDMLTEGSNTPTTQKTGVETTTSSNNTKAAAEDTDTYPSFSTEEMVNTGNEETEEEAAEEVPVDEDGNPLEVSLEYREDVAVLYQQLPANPIRTYGVDGSGRGECTGTICDKFDSIWDNFEERKANKQSLIVQEGERKGQIAMPEAFAQDVKNQPAVDEKAAEKCPEGYSLSEGGNEYKAGSHCGMMTGNTYYVAAPQ